MSCASTTGQPGYPGHQINTWILPDWWTFLVSLGSSSHRNKLKYDVKKTCFVSIVKASFTFFIMYYFLLFKLRFFKFQEQLQMKKAFFLFTIFLNLLKIEILISLSIMIEKILSPTANQHWMDKKAQWYLYTSKL